MIIENLQDAVTVARHAQGDKDAQLIQLLEAMAKRICQLEVRLDRLSDLTVGDTENALSFADKVLEVLDVRSGTARAALGIRDEDDRDDSDFERRVIEAVEERSGSIYSAIEAEIENKLEDWSSSYAFQCAVEEAIAGEAEEIVRKGLRSIL